jgi:diguanylate cyclase (GGDEF)-like protein
MSTSHEALRALPRLPHLDHLKHQARSLQRATERADPAALGRVAASHPRYATVGLESGTISLGDAQLVVAREYGFASWSRLKAHVELSRRARPLSVTLPVVRVEAPFLVPEATLVFHFSDAERRAVEMAVANRSPLLCVAAEGEPCAPDSSGVWAWPAAPRGVRVGRQQTLLWARGRARVCSLRSEGDPLLAETELEPELSWSPVSKQEAVTRLYEALVRLSLRVVWLSRPELSRWREDEDLGRLLGAALKQLGPDVLAQCSTTSDPHALIELVCGRLAERASSERASSERASTAGALSETPRPERAEAAVVVLRSEAHPHVCGRRHDLRGEMTRIGRGDGCEIQLYSDAVSRSHARIERRGSAFWVVDEGSVNGTFRQGDEARLTHSQLADGDRLVVGDAILGFLQGGDLDDKYQALVDELGRTDPLTGLPSRTSWLADLERRLFAARGCSSALSVVMLDLDGLRAENERLGRLAGDRLLVEAAGALRDAERARAARYAGGTFCVILPGCGPEGAREIAEELRRAVSSRSFTVEGETVRATVSGGVASLDATLGVEELVEQAQSALRQAKAEGGDRVASS